MASQPAAPVRQATRVVTDIETTWNAQELSGTALMYNLSIGGCMIEFAGEPLFPGDVLALSMPQIPSLDGRIVWQAGRYAGIQFDQPLDEATVSELGFKEPEAGFSRQLPRDRFGRVLPVLSGRLPF